MSPANDRFHARYLARQKNYRLTIVEGVVGDPFLVGHSWRINETLDLGKMQEAAVYLVGEHDFSSFTADKAKKNKTRNISSIRIDRGTVRGASRVDIVFKSDGFLWNQVRIMAAALVLVGRGEWKPTEVGRILDARDRSLAPPPAPARALTLVSVEYDHA
jgi:tRNA pseudouridine38-40 synthase